MGRFEKRPENQRIRGEISRAAENALWDVVEDLENLQQNLLRSLQEDVKRLESEKTRLSNDIQKLIEEKEQLQQSRQITEQQVLIRQLAEVLAKHISSQLQSSLKTLATQAVDQNVSDQIGLENERLNNNTVNQIGQNITRLLDILDNSMTIAFSSLLQELKNYQGDLSSQLSRMYDQQQQGEAILAEFVNLLRGELEKNRDTRALKPVTGGTPTVLQLAENYQNGTTAKSGSRITVEAVLPIPDPLPQADSTAAKGVILSLPVDKKSELVAPQNPQPTNQDHSSEVISLAHPQTTNQDHSSETNIFSGSETTTVDQAAQLGSVLTSQVLAAPSLAQTQPKPESSVSVSANGSTEKRPTPKLRRETTPKQEITPSQRIDSRTKTTPRHQRSRTSPWPQLQSGLLLICLSTVVSSVYNVAIKAIFYTASNPTGGLPTQQLIFPTLGNIFLILMLRLLVVVPLMILLSPILYPPVWQELENLFAGLRAKVTPQQQKTKQGLFLSVISGGLLFLSQVLIYVALGEVTTGMAIALFFIYPVISVFLSWFVFQERPNLFVTGSMAGIFCGELLVLSGQTVGVNNILLGSTTAIMSGIAFAMYVIFTRICATKLKLHPVSLTLIHFTTMLLLSLICLIIPLPSNLGLAISSSNILELILSAFILGVLTLCGYLFNNFGIRKLGSPISSLIGATVPVFTVIFAGFMLQESLQTVQIMGIMLITVGAAILSRKT
ncbi:MAG: EamA family transporter [Cuspidothrix sp.]